MKIAYLKDANDLTLEISERVEELSLATFSTKSKDIWKKVSSEMMDKSVTYIGMTIDQVINKENRTNNPIKIYNRRINELFAKDHPSAFKWINSVE